LAYFWQGFLESTCRTGILQRMKQEWSGNTHAYDEQQSTKHLA
jgi:hypothetical protein